MTGLATITVPDIGDFKDIPVIEILVKAGDRVSKNSPLVVLESDKATLDVPSPHDGTVRDLKIAVGDRVSVGSVILTLEDEANKPSTSAWALPASTVEPIEVEPIEAVPATSHATAPTTPESVPGNASGDAQLSPYPVERLVPAATAPVEPRRVPHASPSIRRIAREFGVTLVAVQGSGPRGRILRQDVLSFAKAAIDKASTDDAAAGTYADMGGLKLTPWPQIDFSKFGPVERIRQSKIRKLSAANLSRNAVLIPHVTNFEHADITDLEAFRRRLNADNGPTEPKLTILPFLIKAVGATLAKFHDFNSSLDGDELVLKRYIHIGFAADTPNGLVVPVIRDVGTKGVNQIAAEAAALGTQARDGRLKPTDMQGGSFTVSSLGGVGGTGFTPIINAPEVAILGVTRAQMRPVWSGAEFRPRLILPLMLSWDHRVVDGVAAARFLIHLSSLLEDFRRITL